MVNTHARELVPAKVAIARKGSKIDDSHRHRFIPASSKNKKAVRSGIIRSATSLPSVSQLTLARWRGRPSEREGRFHLVSRPKSTPTARLGTGATSAPAV